jgi:hypothetical protein
LNKHKNLLLSKAEPIFFKVFSSIISCSLTPVTMPENVSKINVISLEDVPTYASIKHSEKNPLIVNAKQVSTNLNLTPLVSPVHLPVKNVPDFPPTVNSVLKPIILIDKLLTTFHVYLVFHLALIV